MVSMDTVEEFLPHATDTPVSIKDVDVPVMIEYSSHKDLQWLWGGNIDSSISREEISTFF